MTPTPQALVDAQLKKLLEICRVNVPGILPAMRCKGTESLNKMPPSPESTKNRQWTLGF